MSVRILSQSDVTALLPMRDCMDAMREALIGLARGDGFQPLRGVHRLPGGSGLIATMPGSLGEAGEFGVKVLSVFFKNHGTPFDSHQGVVLLFEPDHGQLVAIMDATAITGIRTAAVSAVATQALAREDAGDLAILGTGTQAERHLEAMALARPLRRVRVWSRDPARVRAFADRARKQRGIEVEPARTAEEAIAGADLVCTVTSASSPVLHGAWVAPGAHVNAVGACTPDSRELDTEAVSRSRLFVDRRESALREAGDVVLPIREGAIDEGHIVAELGHVLAGDATGRRTTSEITLFKSLGIAVEDIAAAKRIHQNAAAAGRGTMLELGGLRAGGD